MMTMLKRIPEIVVLRSMQPQQRLGYSGMAQTMEINIFAK
tara:strand:- start:600 stop:719 length:120 start_codon:yes stop_codon:yes gene_type:complete